MKSRSGMERKSAGLARRIRIRKRILGVSAMIMSVLIVSIPKLAQADGGAYQFNFYSNVGAEDPNKELWTMPAGDCNTEGLSSDAYIWMEQEDAITLMKDDVGYTKFPGDGGGNFDSNRVKKEDLPAPPSPLTPPPPYFKTTPVTNEEVLAEIRGPVTETDYKKFNKIRLYDFIVQSNPMDSTNSMRDTTRRIRTDSSTFDANNDRAKIVLTLQNLNHLIKEPDIWGDNFREYASRPTLYTTENQEGTNWNAVSTASGGLSRNTVDGSYLPFKLTANYKWRKIALVYRTQMPINYNGATTYPKRTVQAAADDPRADETHHIEISNAADEHAISDRLTSGGRSLMGASYLPFRMSLLNTTGNTVTPGDPGAPKKVAVSLPLPNDFRRESTHLYYIDSVTHDLQEATSGGVVGPSNNPMFQFEATRFGEYAFVDFKGGDPSGVVRRSGKDRRDPGALCMDPAKENFSINPTTTSQSAEGETLSLEELQTGSVAMNRVTSALGALSSEYNYNSAQPFEIKVTGDHTHHTYALNNQEVNLLNVAVPKGYQDKQKGECSLWYYDDGTGKMVKLDENQFQLQGSGLSRIAVTRTGIYAFVFKYGASYKAGVYADPSTIDRLPQAAAAEPENLSIQKDRMVHADDITSGFSSKLNTIPDYNGRAVIYDLSLKEEFTNRDVTPEQIPVEITLAWNSIGGLEAGAEYSAKLYHWNGSKFERVSNYRETFDAQGKSATVTFRQRTYGKYALVLSKNASWKVEDTRKKVTTKSTAVSTPRHLSEDATLTISDHSGSSELERAIGQEETYKAYKVRTFDVALVNPSNNNQPLSSPPASVNINLTLPSDIQNQDDVRILTLSNDGSLEARGNRIGTSCNFNLMEFTSPVKEFAIVYIDNGSGGSDPKNAAGKASTINPNEIPVDDNRLDQSSPVKAEKKPTDRLEHVRLVVKEIERGRSRAIEGLVKANSKFSGYTVIPYDLYLEYFDPSSRRALSKVENDAFEYIRITLPLPAETTGKRDVRIVTVSEDERQLEELASLDVTGGKAAKQFQAKHFSEYAIIYTEPLAGASNSSSARSGASNATSNRSGSANSGSSASSSSSASRSGAGSTAGSSSGSVIANGNGIGLSGNGGAGGNGIYGRKGRTNAIDMPRTGEKDTYRTLGALLLFLFGAIELISSVNTKGRGKKTVLE